MVTKPEELDEPTVEKFTEFVSLWMNEQVTAPNWVFTIKANVRRVTHDGTTIRFVMKDGAVYSLTVTQTTQPITFGVQSREEFEAEPDQETDSWLT